VTKAFGCIGPVLLFDQAQGVLELGKCGLTHVEGQIDHYQLAFWRNLVEAGYQGTGCCDSRTESDGE
jgi:hypothetical protein